jgi:hypothetical protein
LRVIGTSILKDLADLPIGWYAEREGPGGPSVRYQHPAKQQESDNVETT